MSSFMQLYDYSPEMLNDILSDLKIDSEKTLVGFIINSFLDAGLTIKVKHIFPGTPNEYYRVLCFIKKSTESVIINTRNDLGKSGVVDGFNLQIRIVNHYTFDNLDEFSENIRSQIISAHDCHFCSSKCEGKRYTFSYGITDYIKCQFLCNNFRFTVQQPDDVYNIVRIIKNEIMLKKN